MENITVRHLNFEFEEEIDPLVLQDDPEMSYLMVGLSMIFPYLEPYLIKNIRVAQKEITNRSLLHDMNQFCHQEGQHYQQHKRFNDKIRKLYPGLAVLEKEVAGDYEHFTSKGLKFGLAFGEGFESLTFPFAIFMYESGMIRDMKDPLGDMYAWHFCEETEHRTVLFDSYYNLYDSYFYRLKVSLIAQYHLVQFMVRCTRVMLKQDGKKSFLTHGGWKGRMKRIWKWIKLMKKYLWPNLKYTYLSNYSPRTIPVPKAIQELTQSYTDRAYKLS